MSYHAINEALHANVQEWEVPEFPDLESSHCPSIGSSMIYRLDDLADSTLKEERIELRFFSRSRILFRLEGTERALADLDKVLPEGRSHWLLDGYSVDAENGLTLEFMPRHACRLAECAQAMCREVISLSGDAYRDAAQARNEALRQQFMRRVFVSGEFQAWEDLGADAVVISANQKRICVFEVEAEIKARKTVLDLTGKRPPRFYVYE